MGWNECINIEKTKNKQKVWHLASKPLIQYIINDSFLTYSYLLKVPKREIFDRSDFPDFYTIKALCVGDFGVKIKKILNNN